MTDAPKTILMEWNEYWRELRVKHDNGPRFSEDKSTKYLRADTVAAQLKAADELVEAAFEIMVDPTWGLEHKTYMKLKSALTAYRKAREEAQ